MFISPFHVQLSSVLCLTKISRKMPKILSGSRNSGSRIRNGSVHFHGAQVNSSKEEKLSYNIFWHGQSGDMLKSAVAHHDLVESTFKEETPQCLSTSAVPKAQGRLSASASRGPVFSAIFLEPQPTGEEGYFCPTPSCFYAISPEVTSGSSPNL